MPSTSRHLTLFFAATLTLLTTLGGCSAIGRAIDCDQMCDELQTCFDGDLDVGRCSDRCEDKAHNHDLRQRLDECTDCLDNNYSCGEVSDQCPVCQSVSDELL